MATHQSSILSFEPIFLDPQQIAAQIIREVFPPCPIRKKPKLICCACGCGKPVAVIHGKPNRYLNHHRKTGKRSTHHSESLNANAIEILQDAKAGRIQLYASRNPSSSGVYWVFASAVVGIKDEDSRRAEFARLKPYLLLSEERTTSKNYVFDVVNFPATALN
jgi:hypothetical protein